MGFPLPPSLLFPAASTGSGSGSGSQCFAWVQAHIALFILDCKIGPCRQRLISHCEFPTKVAWVLGVGGTRGEIASRCHLVSSRGCERGHVGKVQGARALEVHRLGFELSCLLAKFPGAGVVISSLWFTLL